MIRERYMNEAIVETLRAISLRDNTFSHKAKSLIIRYLPPPSPLTLPEKITQGKL